MSELIKKPLNYHKNTHIIYLTRNARTKCKHKQQDAQTQIYGKNRENEIWGYQQTINSFRHA